MPQSNYQKWMKIPPKGPEIAAEIAEGEELVARKQSDGEEIVEPLPPVEPAKLPVFGPIMAPKKEDEPPVVSEEALPEDEEEPVEEEVAEEAEPEGVAEGEAEEGEEEEDDFSDVTGLSPEDEEELFGTGEKPESEEGGEDNFSDITGLSEKDNEELFGTRPRRKKVRRFKRTSRPRPTDGGLGGMSF